MDEEKTIVAMEDLLEDQNSLIIDTLMSCCPDEDDNVVVFEEELDATVEDSAKFRMELAGSPVCVSSFDGTEGLLDDEFHGDVDDEFEVIDPDKVNEDCTKLCASILEKDTKKAVEMGLFSPKVTNGCMDFAPPAAFVTPDHHEASSHPTLLETLLQAKRQLVFSSPLKGVDLCGVHRPYPVSCWPAISSQLTHRLAPPDPGMPLEKIRSSREPPYLPLVGKTSNETASTVRTTLLPKVLSTDEESIMPSPSLTVPDAKSKTPTQGGKNKQKAKKKTPIKRKGTFSERDKERWNCRVKMLKEFASIHGHCRVPYKYPPNQDLANWCKRQRHQYSLYVGKSDDTKKKSALTEERIQTLVGLGFCWDVQESSWEDQFQKLVKYRNEHGHCDVSKTNKSVGRWVHIQRTRFRLGCLSKARTAKLESIGFLWRSPKKMKLVPSKAQKNSEPRPVPKKVGSGTHTC